MRYRLTIRSISPVAVSITPGTANQTVSHGYIPGSTLRGALAQHYLDQFGNVDHDFKMLFTDNLVQFPNIYPTSDNDAETFVMPCTARSCKRFQGFKNTSTEHGMVDLLVAHAAMVPDLLTSLEDCPQEDCNQPLALCENEFYLRCAGSGQAKGYSPVYETISAHRRLINRVGIDSFTATAVPGILYSLDVLNEDQVFSGDILVDNSIGILESFLKPETRFYAGQSRSRGLGLLEIVDLKTLADDFGKLGVVKERVAKFNKVLSEIVDVCGASYFSLDLQSDAIVQDVYMRYLSYIPPEEVARCCGLPLDSLKLLWSGAETIPIRGWNSAHRLFKTGESGIRRGAVFLYKYEGEASDLEIALTGLEKRGIGNRRSEGFGRVLVCNPFHWEVIYK